MPTNQREPLAGGSLGKLAGRAKEMAGNLIDRRDPDREGRSSHKERQAARAEAAADQLDLKEES